MKRFLRTRSKVKIPRNHRNLNSCWVEAERIFLEMLLRKENGKINSILGQAFALPINLLMTVHEGIIGVFLA